LWNLPFLAGGYRLGAGTALRALTKLEQTLPFCSLLWCLTL
jgi:hypothetical protein